ncbi:MAG: glycosyltransferase 61 family protein [Planctomycetia bacterium]
MGDSTLIYDFGANVGDNLDYYLEKADRVVAVEANPALCRAIEARFAAEIAAGRLVVENVVLLADRGPPTTPFLIHRSNHVLSQLPRPSPRRADEFTEVVLPARHVIDVIGHHGPAHYIKIDLEHSDAAILRSLLTHGITPDYISVEIHDVDVFRSLVALGGYQAFKLVDGATVQRVFASHDIATRDGRATCSFVGHSAGPFGNDLPGPWLDTTTMAGLLGRVGRGWKDVHASRVDAPAPVPFRSVGQIDSSPSCASPARPHRMAPGCLRGECLVLADPLLFMTATGEAIISPAIDRSARIRSPETFRQQAATARTLPHTVHDEPAVILACAWDNAFYHFLYDVLGKLAVAELHGITPTEHAVYFNAIHHWQIEALRLLGITPRPLAGGTVHRFTRGVIPTYASVPWSRATPASVRLLRRLRFAAADSLPPRKLFVSRSSPGTARRLDNEAEIFDRCFRPLGYDLVDPGTLPFGEQCALFSAATHVAGPHGAGLSLFCLGRPPVTLIELHSPHFYTDCFRAAAGAAGARYAAFNERREGFQPPHWSATFALDADAVCNWLARLPADIL